MHKVLIVDDSPTSQKVLSAILSADPDLEVVGVASNGREAVEKTKSLRPDVITMDIHMPVMDGLHATKEIMIEAPTPIVIVSASARAQEVEQTMNALRAGALTVLRKPGGPHSPDYESMAIEVVRTVKSMAGVMVIKHRRRRESRKATSAEPATPSIIETPKPSERLKAIALVTSTGGPPALAKVLGELPADFPVPIMVVQHIVPSFLPGFTQWLNSSVAIEVKIAEDHCSLQPGTVYVAPDDRHLGVTSGGRIQLSEQDAIDGFRPAGSYLFASIAASFGSSAVGVIMTGMGRDGVDGLRELQAAGGHVIAQDELTSIVFGMPRVAIEELSIDTVLPLQQIATQLVRLARSQPAKH